MSQPKVKFGGAICGGVISFSMHKENIKKHGVWVDTMAFIMADKYHKKFITYKKQGKDKEANKIFNRYAISQI